MKLTGMCKQDFENWIKSECIFLGFNCWGEKNTIDELGGLFLNALILDFFDSAGFKIIIIPTMFIDNWGCDIFGWTECEFTSFKSREEATTKAIEKANEIYNLETLKKGITITHVNQQEKNMQEYKDFITNFNKNLK